MHFAFVSVRKCFSKKTAELNPCKTSLLFWKGIDIITLDISKATTVLHQDRGL